MRMQKPGTYRAVVIVVACVVASTGSPSSSVPVAAKTKTTGKICRDEPCYIETFSGGDVFKGRTRPSEKGQKVVFEYRRRGSATWHRLGTRSGGGKAFYCTDGTSSTKLRSNGRWREHIDINGFRGYPKRRWVLRAKFLRQDSYRKSDVSVRVLAGYGD
jgi:hypothetical protein